MDDLEVVPLLATESERVEWKEQSQGDAILHAVCALANDLGESNSFGYIVVGVDKRGNVVGVDTRGQQIDEYLQKLSNQIHSIKIQPIPSCSMESLDRDNKTIIVVKVSPYPVPPIVTVNSVPWVRVGTTTRRAKDADLLRLNERRHDRIRAFDSRLHPEATIDDLDRRHFEEQYAIAHDSDVATDSFPDFMGWLTSRRGLGHLVDGVWRPCNAAVLLFGTDPQHYFPGATLQIVRYTGVDFESDVAWRKTVTGGLPSQLDSSWNLIDAHVEQVPVSANGIQQRYAPAYPSKALKELVRNLVQHRTYEGTHAPGRIEWFADRIEFSNPGGPFGRAGEGELGEHSDYRNPTITKELVELGYVEQLGRGLKIVRQQMEKNGNPPLEVEVDGFTRLIVRART